MYDFVCIQVHVNSTGTHTCLPFLSPCPVDKVKSTSLLSSGGCSACHLSGCMTVPSEATVSLRRHTVWKRQREEEGEEEGEEEEGEREREGEEGEGEGSKREIKVAYESVRFKHHL